MTTPTSVQEKPSCTQLHAELNNGLNAGRGRTKTPKPQVLAALVKQVKAVGTLNTTTRSIAAELNTSVGTVQTVLKELAAMGLLHVQKSHAGTTLEWIGGEVEAVS